MTSECSVTCKGFLSVRAECARNPCLAQGMCSLTNPSVSPGDCAAWCCVNRGWYIFFMVVTFGAGTFALCAAYYLHRLHAINVSAGAAGEDGEVVVSIAPEEMSDAATDGEIKRKKRIVQADPSLMRGITAAS